MTPFYWVPGLERGSQYTLNGAAWVVRCWASDSHVQWSCYFSPLLLVLFPCWSYFWEMLFLLSLSSLSLRNKWLQHCFSRFWGLNMDIGLFRRRRISSARIPWLESDTCSVLEVMARIAHLTCSLLALIQSEKSVDWLDKRILHDLFWQFQLFNFKNWNVRYIKPESWCTKSLADCHAHHLNTGCVYPWWPMSKRQKPGTE